MKSNLKWLGLLAAVVMLFYWKIVLTDQFSLLTESETVNQGYSWFTYQARTLQHGSLPMWDPFVFAGRSFPGEMQTGAFSPLNWLLALAPLNHHGLLSPRLYHEFFVFAHWLGAIFMFALIREFGLGRFPAFLAGVCFSLAGFVGQVPWPDRFTSVIWLPLVLLFLLRAFRAARPAEIVFSTAIAGMFVGLSILAGGMHIAIMQALVMATAIVYRAASGPRLAMPGFVRNRPWVWTGVIVAAGLVVTGCTGAVQLLPSHEYAARSIRFLGSASVPSDQKIAWAYLHDQMNPQGLVSLVFFSAISGNGEVWSPYVGVFPLMLAFLGIWKRWSHLWVRYLAVIACGFFVVALGNFTPLHGVLYATVPFLWLAREATRFIYLVQFALCVLAAFGLDALMLSAGLRFVEWRAAATAAKWAAIAAAAFLFVTSLLPHLDLSPWYAYSLLLILASCGLLYLFLSRPLTRGILTATAVLVFLDLGAFNWGARNRIDAATTNSDYYSRLLSCEPAARFLNSRPGPFRVVVEGATSPNIGDAFGIETTGGMAATLENAFVELAPHADLLNVKYRLKAGPPTGAGSIYSDGAWTVYENPDAFPRAWIVHTVLAREKLKPSQAVDMHHVALWDRPSRAEMEPELAGDSGTVTFRSYQPNRMEMSVAPKSAGLLVLSELYYPGWHAVVNGKPAPIYPVDGGLRAIAVPAGESLIAVRYAPVSIYAGGILTLTTLSGVLIASAFFRREEQGNALAALAASELKTSA